MARIHRTAQGKPLDMEALRLKNEMVPALGNMRVNARGDLLGPGGKVIKTREMRMDEFYRARPGKSERPTKGPVPTSGRTRPTKEAIPTTSEFSPGEIFPDETLDKPIPEATEVKPELRGGLASAIKAAETTKER